jgi:hypothetical protein
MRPLEPSGGEDTRAEAFFEQRDEFVRTGIPPETRHFHLRRAAALRNAAFQRAFACVMRLTMRLRR